MIHPNYPTPQQVDQWCDKLLRDSDTVQYAAVPAEMPDRPGEVRARHTTGQFIAFETPTSGASHGVDRFYAYFQPVCGGGPAPLLVHLPGYGGELSMHPELVAAGFNVLHVNPRGYYTPQGPDDDKRLDGAWPVLPETVLSLGERGYVQWYRDALIAVRWAQAQKSVQPERLGFFGTSQGWGHVAGAFQRDARPRGQGRRCGSAVSYALPNDVGNEIYGRILAGIHAA
jgi:hypothetical protein